MLLKAKWVDMLFKLIRQPSKEQELRDFFKVKGFVNNRMCIEINFL